MIGIYLLVWAGVSVSLLIGTFLFYVALMKMRDVQAAIFDGSIVVRYTCWFLLIGGLIFDTLLNWWFLTITYYEIPQEFLSTARIVRHKKQSNGFRQIQSLYWCKYWLTPFDIHHCD
jgi:hypothetical protein